MGKGGMCDGEKKEAENLAAWLVAKNTLKIQPFKLPPLGSRDVKIRVKAVGICGSDVHYFKAMRVANFIVKEPMVLGHECAGIIEEVGSEVRHLVVGDRVALEPGISCSRCNICKDGRYNLCRNMKFFSSPPTNGSLANQVVHPADLCFKLPENVSLEEGAMCEPLSVGIHACRRANVGPETNVLIVGAGPIGLVMMLAARAFGAPRIVIVDVDDYRLSVGKDLGADQFVKVSTSIQDVDAEVGEIQKAMGVQVDVAFDCVGFGKTMSTALNATRAGGKVCLVGLGHSEMTVPLSPAAAREVDIVGIFRYKNTWPLCLELLKSGKIDVKPLVTHRFGFSQEEVVEAFETSARGGSAIKKKERTHHRRKKEMGKGGMSHGEKKEEENMAAWLVAKNTLKIQPFKLPPLGPHDVKVRMKAVGICGSDVHYLRAMRVADFIVKEPMVIGHECAGIIEEVGSEVKHLVVGDRVALEPGISCSRCNICKDGRYNLCRDMKFFATPPFHGSLANQVVHPADLCFKLPENVSLEEGAMCEPLSVGIHSCRRANVGPETNVLIVGAGPIGLVMMLAARAFGAPRIVIVDVDDYRLSVAKDLGADQFVKVSTSIQDVDAEVGEIQKAMGAQVDVAFDCVGFGKTMSTALNATRAGGKVCLVGMGHSEMTVPLTPAAAREVDIVGVFRYKNTWPLCLEFLRSGKIDVKPLITHRFGFSQEEVVEAFETSARGGSAIKVMFNL